MRALSPAALGIFPALVRDRNAVGGTDGAIQSTQCNAFLGPEIDRAVEALHKCGVNRGNDDTAKASVRLSQFSGQLERLSYQMRAP